MVQDPTLLLELLPSKQVFQPWLPVAGPPLTPTPKQCPPFNCHRETLWRISLLRKNFSWAYCPCGWVWLGCGFITIKSLSYICCIFKHHLLSEIKYSYCSHDAGLTDWSENQLCPQTLPVLMEPLNMDSLNKATSSEGACASLSEGSTSETHNSAFGTQHPCREKHFQLLTLQRDQPYTHQK